MEAIKTMGNEQRMQTAFDAAEEHLGVAQLLETNDFAQGAADDKSVILYVAKLKQACDERVGEREAKAAEEAEASKASAAAAAAAAEADAAAAAEATTEAPEPDANDLSDSLPQSSGTTEIVNIDTNDSTQGDEVLDAPVEQ